MSDNVTLNNGLTLGGMFQEKEKLIQQLQEENSCLRMDKARLTAENQTVLLEQAQTIAHLNQQLRLLTGEQTKYLSTVEILEAVKMEKNFLEEDSKIQEDERKKLKEQICKLKKTITQYTTESSNLATKLKQESLALQEETTENYTLSCLVGERDVTIEQCRAELARMTADLDVLKHSLASKDTKLRNVLDERNHAQWKLQDFLKSNSKKKSSSNSYIPVTPPRIDKKRLSNDDHSVSPTTITATLEKEGNMSIAPAPSPPSPHLLPTMDEKTMTFDLKEKHYLSLIFRLRSELAKMKRVHQTEEDVKHLETSNQRLPLQSKFVRKSVKPLRR